MVTYDCLKLATIQEINDELGVSKIFDDVHLGNIYISKKRLQTFVHLETMFLTTLAINSTNQTTTMPSKNPYI